MSRAHSGKSRVSPAKEKEVRVRVEACFGDIARLFVLLKSNVENENETLFANDVAIG